MWKFRKNKMKAPEQAITVRDDNGRLLSDKEAADAFIEKFLITGFCFSVSSSSSAGVSATLLPPLVRATVTTGSGSLSLKLSSTWRDFLRNRDFLTPGVGAAPSSSSRYLASFLEVGGTQSGLSMLTLTKVSLYYKVLILIFPSRLT